MHGSELVFFSDIDPTIQFIDLYRVIAALIKFDRTKENTPLDGTN